jgi:hypothetical protein
MISKEAMLVEEATQSIKNWWRYEPSWWSADGETCDLVYKSIHDSMGALKK